MGCFETFIETKPSSCPKCGAAVEPGWQSKDGPCDMLEFKQGDHLSQGRFCGNHQIDPKYVPEFLGVESWTGCAYCTGKPEHFLEADIIVEGGVFVRVENIRYPYDSREPKPK